VSPASPVAQETVRVRVPRGVWGQNAFGEPDFYDARETRVLMTGNTISISLQMGFYYGYQDYPPGLDLPLGQFPPGDYQVEVTKRSVKGDFLGSMGSATFSVMPSSRAQPFQNVTGLWWTPSESGWGVNIAQNGAGALFATWFVYGPDGKPVWYHMPAGQWDTRRFVCPIYRTTGPLLQGCPESACRYIPFDPTAVTRTLVGTATFFFDEYAGNTGYFYLTIDGETVGRTIQRLDF
jgi:hypothetical protein